MKDDFPQKDWMNRASQLETWLMKMAQPDRIKGIASAISMAYREGYKDRGGEEPYPKPASQESGEKAC